jgi:hypothetical protein
MTPPHFYIFVIISPLRGVWTLIWTNLNFLHPRMICTKFDWIWPSSSGEEDFFKIFSAFLLFRYYLPFKKGSPLDLNKRESPRPKDDLCQVWFKLAQWFWRRRFLYDPTPILHFCEYLPFEEDLALYLNKLESPSPKDDLYQLWLNLAQWFWRRKFLNIFSVFFILLLLSPLGEGQSPSFEQTWIPSPQGWFVPSLVKIGPVVLEKKSKM